MKYVIFTISNEVVRMKIKKMIVSGVLSATLAVTASIPNIPILENKVRAEGACSMTINSSKNTSFDTAATANGECRDLVFGYYANGTFLVEGLVTAPVSYSGQKFTIYPPSASGGGCFNCIYS